MSAALRRSVGPFQVPNYRRWFAGQLVSVGGNWMQIVAELWLVLTLTGSAFAVGLTTALQFLPILVAGAWGGLIADSMPKRKLLLRTQKLMALPALTLFALAVSGDVAAWMVMALVLARGCVLAVDMPARQSFVIEIVGPDRVVGAVGLQSVLIHASRITGPALAGLLIASGGIELCFLLNGLSFGAMILALRSLDTQALQPPKLATRERGAVRSALRYVTRTPELAIPLGMMALVGTMGFNFQVILPLLARETFGGDAASYSALVVAMGAGAVAGALLTGSRERIGERLLTGSGLALGVVALAVAAAPTLTVAALVLVPLGAASVVLAAGINSTLQLAAEPHMRGRVMALYSVVFLGSTAIGGPITGLLSGALGPRAALVMVSAAALAAAAGARIAFARVRPPAEVAEASDAADDRDTGQACERAGSAGTPSSARRRSGPRRAPRSQEPQPRAGAKAAR